MFSSFASSSRSDSESAVSPSARSLVVGFSVDRATSRKLLPAVEAQGAALLIDGDCSFGHRHGLRALLRGVPPPGLPSCS